MSFADQVQGMMRSWIETQQKLATQWTDAAGKMGAGPTWSAEPWTTQWRDTARRSAQAWLDKVGGVPKEVGLKMMEGADSYMHFVDFFVDAMQKVAPKVDAGTDWTKAFRDHVESLRSAAMADPSGWMKPGLAAAAGQDGAELWKLFAAQMKVLAEPWSHSIAEAQGHFGEAMAGDRRALIRMANLFTDTYESTLGKFTSAPAIGHTREYQEKLTKAFEAWVDARRSEAVYHTELMNAGFRAMEALAGVLEEKGKQGEKITSPKALFTLWIEVAEKVYFESARSEAFAKAQAGSVNAAMHYRIHERILLEELYRAYHIPTRSELDDAYRHLYETRKEVKRIKADLAALRKETAALKALVEKADKPAPAAAPRALVEKAGKPAPAAAPRALVEKAGKPAPAAAPRALVEKAGKPAPAAAPRARVEKAGKPVPAAAPKALVEKAGKPVPVAAPKAPRAARKSAPRKRATTATKKKPAAPADKE